jgi:Xaa-Pro aminopeptidase
MERARQLKIEAYFLTFADGSRANLVGHGIGLELNEPPILADYDHSTIHNGYTLALEMHAMHPQQGVVKLEDTLVVSPLGAELLSLSPRELVEVNS